MSLSDRRTIQKLVLIYKHRNGDLPGYLNALFPLTVGNHNPYNVRNDTNYATIARRLEIYSKSVIPSSIKLWNELNTQTRESGSLTEFKQELKQRFKAPSVQLV